MRTVAILSLAAAAVATGNGDWSYVDQDNWGEHYPGCAAGAQSPINLYTGIHGEDTTTGFRALSVDFSESASGSWANNGHSIQITFEGEVGTTKAGSAVMPVAGMGADFNLLQLHFHSPSEPVVDGKSYPLEGHFVHQSADGELAVVSVFFDDETDEANDQIQVLFESVPIIGAKRHVESVDLNGFLPEGSRFFSYIGSTTTPPCVAGVRWNIFETPVSISSDQLARFNRYFRGNNRKLQELEDGRFATLQSASADAKTYPTLETEYEMPEYFEPEIPQ